MGLFCSELRCSRFFHQLVCMYLLGEWSSVWTSLWRVSLQASDFCDLLNCKACPKGRELHSGIRLISESNCMKIINKTGLIFQHFAIGDDLDNSFITCLTGA